MVSALQCLILLLRVPLHLANTDACSCTTFTTTTSTTTTIFNYDPNILVVQLGAHRPSYRPGYYTSTTTTTTTTTTSTSSTIAAATLVNVTTITTTTSTTTLTTTTSTSTSTSTLTTTSTSSTTSSSTTCVCPTINTTSSTTSSTSEGTTTNTTSTSTTFTGTTTTTTYAFSTCSATSTIGGNECAFPFDYNGTAYTACTSVDAEAPWCKIDLSSSHVLAGQDTVTDLGQDYGYCDCAVEIASILGLATSGYNLGSEVSEMNGRLRKAYELFVAWINSVRGGVYVNGRWMPLTVTLFDSEMSLDKTEKLANHVLGDLAYKFILGPYGSAESEVVAKTAELHSALAMMPAPAESASLEGRSMVFGMQPDSRSRMHSLFEFMNGSATSVAYVTEEGSLSSVCERVPIFANTTVPKMMYNSSRQHLHTLSREGSNLNLPVDQLVGAVESLRSQDPDLVILCVSDQSCHELVASFTARNYNPSGLIVSDTCMTGLPQASQPFVFVSTQWLPTIGHVSDSGQGLSHRWTSANFHHKFIHDFGPAAQISSSRRLGDANSGRRPLGLGRSLSEISAHAEMSGDAWEPLYLGASGFAALEILVAAIEAAGTLDPMKVKEKVETMTFRTVYGGVSFDGGSQNTDHYKVVQMQSDGLYSIVGPSSQRTGDTFFYPIPSWSERPCKVKLPVNWIYGFYSGSSKPEDAQTVGLSKDALMKGAAFAATVNKLPLDASHYEQKAGTEWVTYVNSFMGADWPGAWSPKPNGTTDSINAAIDAVLMNDYKHGPLTNLTQRIFAPLSGTALSLVEEAIEMYYLTLPGRSICGPCPEVAVYENGPPAERVCRSCNASQVVFSTADGMERQCGTACKDGEGMNAMQVCVACPAGRVSQSTGSIMTCVDCETGKFTGKAKQTVCQNCAPGKYAARGATTCTACPVGEEAQAEKSDSCVKCSRGTVTDSLGSSSCKLCEAGSIANLTGLTNCSACQAGKYSAWGAKICMPCEAGKYQNRDNQSKCIQASAGATFASVGLKKGSNKAGYWARHQNDNISWEHCKHAPIACLEDEKCAEGSTGIQCGACLPGYFSPQWMSQGSCQACPPLLQNLLTACIFVLLVWFLAVCLTRLAVSSVTRPSDLHVPLIKIFVHYGVIVGVSCIILKKVIWEMQSQLDQVTADIAFTGVFVHVEFWMGRPLAESRLWSLSCLFSSANDALATSLKALKPRHSDWFKQEWAVLEKELYEHHLKTEVNIALFWCALPIVMVVVIYCISLLALVVHFLRKRGKYAAANQFYNDLLKEGPAYVKDHYEAKSLQPHFKVFKFHFLGIWWPFNYLHAVHRQGVCYRRRTFGGEIKPLILTVLFLIYGATALGILRPFYCDSFGQTSPPTRPQRMIHANTIVCQKGEGDWGNLIVYSNIGCVLWGGLFPIAMCWTVARNKSLLLNEEWWKVQNSILIIGYNAKCAWWESVIFLDKFLLVYLSHAGMDVNHTILYQMLLALVYGALNFAFKPCDKRCGGVLWKLQMLLIGLRVADCIVLEMLMLTTSRLAWAMLLCVCLLANILFVVYVLWKLFEFGRVSFVHHYSGAGDSFSWLKVFGAEEDGKRKKIRKIGGCCLSPVLAWFYESQRLQQKTQSYISFDHLLGWVNIVGNHGDLVVNPTIERGHRCQNRSGRPDLSEAPLVPTRVPADVHMRAGKHKDCKYLHQVLSETMISLTTGLRYGSTYSVSAMEFLIRIGFFLAQKHNPHNSSAYQKERQQAKSQSAGQVDSTDLPPEILQLTADEGHEKQATPEEQDQFLCNLGDQLVHKVADMKHSGRFQEGSAFHKSMTLRADQSRDKERYSRVKQGSLDHLTQGGAEDLQENLEVTLEMLLDEVKHRTKMGHTKQLRKSMQRHDTSMDQAAATDNLGGAMARYVSKGVQMSKREMDRVVTEAVSENDIEAATMSNQLNKVRINSKYNIDYDLTSAKKSQLTHWVELMLNPLLYSRGIRLDQFQQAMARLQTMRRSEVRFLLDVFEDHWVQHNSYKAVVLKRCANLTKDMPLQVEMEEAQHDVSVADCEAAVTRELKLGKLQRGVDDSRDPVREARVAYRWARMVMIRGDALSQFDSTQLVQIMKENTKRKYRAINLELDREAGNLQEKKEALAKLLPPGLAEYLHKPAADAQVSEPALALGNLPVDPSAAAEATSPHLASPGGDLGIIEEDENAQATPSMSYRAENSTSSLHFLAASDAELFSTHDVLSGEQEAVLSARRLATTVDELDTKLDQQLAR